MGSKWGQIYFSLLAMLCSWSAVMITETCLSSIGLGFGQVSVSSLGLAHCLFLRNLLITIYDKQYLTANETVLRNQW